MPDPEVVKIKQARRQILESLNMTYPTALRLESIFRVNCSVDPSYEWHLLEKDIFYLKEKGYVEFVDDVIGLRLPLNKKTAKLTADGKDIADRTMSDSTLEF